MKQILAGLSMILLMTGPVAAQQQNKTDTLATGSGPLIIHFLGHASLMFEYDGKVLYADPVSQHLDPRNAPRADIVLVTHSHGDHYDRTLIDAISGPSTTVIIGSAVEKKSRDIVLLNGARKNISGISVEAVPAYNTTPGREQFHPRGRDNGYVVSFGKYRVYIAGDTEDIPEMKDLRNIDVAFLPMNQPYTMTPAQVAEAVKMFHPKILYPYHYGTTDVEQLRGLLKGIRGTELRVRPLQ